MRLQNIQTALVPFSGTIPQKRRPMARKRAKIARAGDFESLLSRENIIEADFEEIKPTGGKSEAHYQDVLFPMFLWKCLYVNYYV